jgi:hypothetical protein
VEKHVIYYQIRGQYTNSFLMEYGTGMLPDADANWVSNISERLHPNVAHKACREVIDGKNSIRAIFRRKNR